jgi:ribosome-associated heat shock protein Hsp15
MRFDVALHELRLFKSRSQASAAIERGEALLNGAAVKPSRAIAPGDMITLAAAGRSRTLEVLELPARSVSREAAQAMVREVERG